MQKAGLPHLSLPPLIVIFCTSLSSSLYFLIALGGKAKVRNMPIVFCKWRLWIWGFSSVHTIFSERYVNDKSKFESLCGELHHTSQKARDDCFSAMQAMTTEPETQLAVCLFVCFRLRNNLFHGPKWRYFLEGQEGLLLSAGDLIHSILSCVPKEDGWAFQNILDSYD